MNTPPTAPIRRPCPSAPVGASFWDEAALTADVTAEILARSPERGNFLPRTLTFPAGEKVRLRIRNVDTVTHGFASPGLGIEALERTAGHSAIVEFTPTTPGTYAFYCTAWCSEHHLQMKGVIEITKK